MFRERMSHNGLRWVNRISGVIIICFGLMAIMSLCL
jgi:hypothetical protein